MPLSALTRKRLPVFLLFYREALVYNLGVSLLSAWPVFFDPGVGLRLGVFVFCFLGYPFVLYGLHRLRPQQYFFYHNFGFGKWQLWGLGACVNFVLALLFVVLLRLLPWPL